MAKKGEKKAEKRLAAPKARKIKRKEFVWGIRTKSGPHSSWKAVPLGSVLRDHLGITRNLRETKRVLSEGKVLVDGVARKDYGFPVGLFDLILVEALKKKFRVVLDRKGRLELKEIDFKAKDEKLGKIVSKKAVKNGVVMLTTHDGRNFLEKKTDLNNSDSIRFSLPEQKIIEGITMDSGNFALVIGGRHSGEKAKIKEIIPGTMRRKKGVVLRKEENEFKTTAENVFVVGKKKPEIDLGEGK